MLFEKMLGEVFFRTKVIAVVGASRDPEKDAQRIPLYMKQHGYKIIPVNPYASDLILGEKVYPTLADVPIGVDLVNVFRPSAECLDVSKQAIALSPRPNCLWMQLGIRNEEARSLAEQAGIKVIMDKCIMVEHRRNA